MNDNVKYQCQLFVHSTMILIIYILNTYLKGINKKLFTTGAQFRSSMLKTNNLVLSWANPTFLLPVLQSGWGLAGRAGWITEYCCVSCAPPPHTVKSYMPDRRASTRAPLSDNLRISRAGGGDPGMWLTDCSGWTTQQSQHETGRCQPAKRFHKSKTSIRLSHRIFTLS